MMLQEPLLVIGAFYLLFLTVIIYVRLDFSITKVTASTVSTRVTISNVISRVTAGTDLSHILVADDYLITTNVAIPKLKNYGDINN